MTYVPYEATSIPFRAENFDDAMRIKAQLIQDEIPLEDRDTIQICSHPEEDGSLTYYVLIRSFNLSDTAQQLMAKDWI